MVFGSKKVIHGWFVLGTAICAAITWFVIVAGEHKEFTDGRVYNGLSQSDHFVPARPNSVLLAVDGQEVSCEVVDLGFLDLNETRQIVWAAKNESNALQHLKRVETDCSCENVVPSSGVIAPLGELTGTITYLQTTLGATYRSVKFVFDDGVINVKFKSVKSRDHHVSRSSFEFIDTLDCRIPWRAYYLDGVAKSCSIQVADVEYDHHIFEHCDVEDTSAEIETFEGADTLARYHIYGKDIFLRVRAGLPICNYGTVVHINFLDAESKDRVGGIRAIDIPITLNVRRGFSVSPYVIGFFDSDGVGVNRVRRVQLTSPRGFLCRECVTNYGSTTHSQWIDSRFRQNGAETFVEVRLAENIPTDTALEGKITCVFQRDEHRETVEIPVRAFVQEARRDHGR